MPLLSIDTVNQLIHHLCPNCGDAHPFAFAALVLGDTITTPFCPACLVACESLRIAIADYEVGTGTHPGGLLEHQFQDTGGIVTEHLLGYDLIADRVAMRRRHRALHAALVAAGLMSQIKAP